MFNPHDEVRIFYNIAHLFYERNPTAYDYFFDIQFVRNVMLEGSFKARISIENNFYEYCLTKPVTDELCEYLYEFLTFVFDEMTFCYQTITLLAKVCLTFQDSDRKILRHFSTKITPNDVEELQDEAENNEDWVTFEILKNLSDQFNEIHQL